MSKTDTSDRMSRTPAAWTREKALPHMAALCAKCEQCEADLREKMRRHALTGAEADAVIDYLYEHRFLDEERFARAYARDKLRFNGWGRMKIAMMLRSKHIPAHVVKTATGSLPEDEYRDIAGRLVRSAARSQDLTAYADRAKLMRRMYARGFESDLVRELIADMVSDES